MKLIGNNIAKVVNYCKQYCNNWSFDCNKARLEIYRVDDGRLLTVQYDLRYNEKTYSIYLNKKKENNKLYVIIFEMIKNVGFHSHNSFWYSKENKEINNSRKILFEKIFETTIKL